MSRPQSGPDRKLLLATLRDYVEQLREEGLEGIPLGAGAPRPRGAAPAPSRPTTAAAAAAVGSARSKTAPNPPIAAGGDGAPRRAVASGALLATHPGLEKTADLDALREFIGDCQRCKLAPGRTNLVFGVGNPGAELMFVGEGPGAEEDARGEPFVGRAGQLLTDIIERGMGMARSDVYICNVVKCRPPGNRNPEADEVAACEPFLMRQIELVAPRVIVGLGTFAVQALLRVKTPISKLRGTWHEMRGIKLMPTFHPAYLLRNPGDKRLVWSDIQEVLKVLGRPIPRRGGSSR
ncbi:MAG TPA: uracil-DNA glycosylase [Candidatus Binataceae bacterium]|nr:uracil-DNA glycosylase [Candidatus Binataceae bacterium]